MMKKIVITWTLVLILFAIVANASYGATSTHNMKSVMNKEFEAVRSAMRTYNVGGEVTIGATQTLDVEIQGGEVSVNVASGTLPVTIGDSLGRSGMITSFGEQLIIDRTPTISLSFVYNLSAQKGATATVNTGTTTVADSMLNLSTGANPTGAASFESIDFLRYVAGSEAYVLFTAIFSTPAANATQTIGLYDAQDGWLLGYRGTDFSVRQRKNGADAAVTQSNFNLDTIDGSGDSGFTYDPTKLNLFQITYAYLGAAPAIFWVCDENGIWIPFHIFQNPNSLTGVNVSNPTHHMRADVSKTSGATDIVLKSGSWSAGDGKQSRAPNRNQFVGNTKSGVTTETSIFTLRAKDTFQGRLNLVPVEVNLLTVGVIGAKPTTIRVRRDATIVGVPSYADVEGNESTLEIDTAGAGASGGTLLLSVALSGNDSFVLSGDALNEVHFEHGQTLTFSAESSGAGTEADIQAGLDELF